MSITRSHLRFENLLALLQHGFGSPLIFGVLGTLLQGVWRSTALATTPPWRVGSKMMMAFGTLCIL